MKRRSFAWVCMVFVYLGLTACSGQKTPDPETWIVMLNGILYYGTDETGPMGDSGCVGGKIQSTVEAGEIPTENEQSNFGAVGNPYTRDEGDGGIMVSVGEEWYCFYAEGEEEGNGK